MCVGADARDASRVKPNDSQKTQRTQLNELLLSKVGNAVWQQGWLEAFVHFSRYRVDKNPSNHDEVNLK